MSCSPACYAGFVQPSACIELVDDLGHAEDTVTMVGSGASVSLQEDDQHRVSMNAFRSAADIAWVSLRGDGTVEVEIVRRDAFMPGHPPLGSGRLHVAVASKIELWLDAVKKYIRVRSVTADLQELRGCEVLAVVFRPADITDTESAALRSWAEGTMREGMEQVQARLDRLRRAGLIDENDRRVVDLPADMLPTSRTDV